MSGGQLMAGVGQCRSIARYYRQDYAGPGWGAAYDNPGPAFGYGAEPDYGY
jgi:hypothetical protein